jgi:hypothetical protein
LAARATMSFFEAACQKYLACSIPDARDSSMRSS